MSVSKLSNISSNVTELRLAHQLGAPEKANSGSFADSLKTEYEKSGLQLSKHALQRMQSRGMEMTPGLLHNLDEAVQKARTKGSKDVVVIGDRGAFIVNIPNSTVVTAMNQNDAVENVFTNIDGAVII